MDFYNIGVKETRNGVEIYPEFLVQRSKDLMIRGQSFYAVWDADRGLWSTDEYDVRRFVDEDLRREADKRDGIVNVKYLRSSTNSAWNQWRTYLRNLSDNYHDLDEKLTFANQTVKRDDYVSRKLPYALEKGDISAWDEMLGVLYSVEERRKIEWVIGAIVSGDSKKIQKFLVLYGPAGTGKSTVLSIIAKLFVGYTTTFEAKALGSNNNQFATEAFKSNPLVAIQHDGDLSKIEDNTKLNSIISHEYMMMNEKYKPSYSARVNAFLLMGTNQPVKISDAKSGIIRRLIDVHPTGAKLPPAKYQQLMSQIDFELGAIAYHCLQLYKRLGKNYYETYRPTEMMLQTDVFFNFIEAHYDIFKAQNGASLKQAYSLYKEFCDNTGIDRPLPQYKFREELRNYFDEFKDRVEVDGDIVRSYYMGFSADKYKAPLNDDVKSFKLVLDETESLFDEAFAEYPAQGATEKGTPKTAWSRVRTTLADIDTGNMHFVKVPENHIVIDFDLKDENGAKALDRNLEAASIWPHTYAEVSKSGNGIHLHYEYSGDVSQLRTQYSDGIEIKVFAGNASLRRRLSKCNSVPIATLTSGLPIKEKKPMLGSDTIQSEKGLRNLIARNLNRDIHPGTKPSVQFIKHILDQEYERGLNYDVSDLKPQIIAFAASSSNNSLECIKMTQQMKFKGKDVEEKVEAEAKRIEQAEADDPIAIFDVEVYPNLFVVCWKYYGADTVVRMINPTPQEIEQLMKLKLVGFYNRRYDNHILYARFMGYDNAQLFALSQKLVGGNQQAYFGEAYDISYADIYDFSSIKQSLKKFMIDLGINKVEMDIPWDQPVPDEMIDKVVEYCVNDVEGTEKTFADREQDFVARQILAELSGLPVNAPTAKHTAKIIFGNDRNPVSSFVYTDLSEQFPGYKFEMGKSSYRGEDPGEGGYVYSEKGMYTNVALLDVASMHPTSLINLNMFGDYTPNFKQLLDARLAIKRGDYAKARKMLDGRLAPYLQDEGAAKALSYALKIVINIVYGLTSAKFNNPFRDNRNKDNIVAKRGALFMIELKQLCQDRGMTVVHIKTDSIKIADATEADINFVMEIGKDYGYDFEHEATYDAFCLVNDAVYIARQGSGKNAKWTAVGAQFQHPYVFKTLFTKEEVGFADLVETKQVTKGAMYIDFEGREEPTRDQMQFIGRFGSFIPVTAESGLGGTLYRVSEEDKRYAVTGTKGYLWMESALAAHQWPEISESIDWRYYEGMAEDAITAIDFWGPFEHFVNG
jgi:energy-coupling factor transporter ATP-binding protein EcfA2